MLHGNPYSNPEKFPGVRMGATPTRDRESASDLIRRGYPHGRRMSKGLSNIPPLSDTGSAAYRRLEEKGNKNKKK